MIFDTHMHTEISSDSDMKISDVLSKREFLNIGTILTEHVDYNYPVKDLFKADMNEFFSAYSKYRNENLLLGVEVGLSSSIVKENNALVESWPFDYVIGSVHSIHDKDIYNFFSSNSMKKEEFFKTYFEEAIKYVSEFDNFDSLGHIDYPCRYCNYDNNEFTIAEHGTYLETLFSLLISKGKVLELNTRRLNIPHVYNSLIPVYKLYVKLGGKYVTLGSDSHEANSIGCNFDLALSFLDETRLTPVYFKERTIQITHLSDYK